jgi:hypothetical protein
MNVREPHLRIAALDFAVRHILNESCGSRGSSSYWPRRYRPGGHLPGEHSELWAPVVSLRWSGPDSFRTRRLENQRGYNEGISVPAAVL